MTSLRRPWADKIGDPHLHECGCGHSFIAPLQPSEKTPCPSCTDENGHNYLDRQVIALARGAVERYGLAVILGGPLPSGPGGGGL